MRLDSDATEWTQDDHHLPNERESGAAAFDGKRIVFAGGNDYPNVPEAKKDDVWARTPDGAWTRLGPLQQPRDHLAAATDGAGTVWFVGGSPDRTAADVVKGDSVTAGPRVDIMDSAAVGLVLGSARSGEALGADVPLTPNAGGPVTRSRRSRRRPPTSGRRGWATPCMSSAATPRIPTWASAPRKRSASHAVCRSA